MKIQNPSQMFDWTNTWMGKANPICSSPLQSWEHNETSDPNGTGNMICTLMMYGEPFYVCYSAQHQLQCARKINKTRVYGDI